MSDLLGIKVRLYPTEEQMRQLDRTFGCCRFLWNQMLAEHQRAYKQYKLDGIKSVYKTEAQYKFTFPFLKEVDAIALQASREHLEQAYINFFKNLRDRKEGKTKRRVGLPRFKCKHKSTDAFTTKLTNSNLKIDFKQRKLKIPKLNSWIAYRDNRTFNEPIHSITVSKTKSGAYYASILIERANEVVPMTAVHAEKVIAFDMSMRDFVVTKEYKLQNPRFFRKSLNKIKRAHRKVSRTKKWSKNHRKACRKLAKRYDHYVHQKKDWTHKITTQLVKKHDAIILEDLNIEGMKRCNKGWAKGVTKDFSWGEFSTILGYKLVRRGKHLIKVNRFFPSSQLCSNCGYQYTDLTLAEREWDCPRCRVHHDRDVNASQNLRTEGLRILSEQGITLIGATVGTTGSHACGDCVRPPLVVATVEEARTESTDF